MILPAQTIRLEGIIDPFNTRQTAFGKTFGLSSAGYDIRSGTSIQVYSALPRIALISSLEHFDMPDDVMGFIADKSTWARTGLFVQNTVIEPGWRGYLTLELTYNGAKSYAQINVGEPIAQVIFCRLEEPTEIPYSGKYQDQRPEPIPAILTEAERERPENN